MSKLDINEEQVVCGLLLLNFENISSLDISIFTCDFLKKNYNYDFIRTSNYNNLKKYIDVSDGIINLKDDINLDSYIYSDNISFKRKLINIADFDVMRYLRTFDIEKFILKKINYLKSVRLNDINNTFCGVERKCLEQLFFKGYVNIIDANMKLSRNGSLCLYKREHNIQIGNLLGDLKDMGYILDGDNISIDDFLLNQNLDLPTYKILNIDNLLDYFDNYKLETCSKKKILSNDF